MFCEKCGNRLREGSAFCNNCGTPAGEPIRQSANHVVADNYQNAPANQQSEPLVAPQTNYENVGGQPQGSFFEEPQGMGYKSPRSGKKAGLGKAKIPVIVVLAVFVLFVGTCAACRFVPGITDAIFPRTTNFVMKNFASPKRYLKFVTTEQGGEKNIGKLVSDTAELIQNSTLSGNGVEGNIKLTAGSGLKDIIKQNAGAEASPYIEWIDSIGISYDGGLKDSLAGYKMGLSVNDSNVLTLDSVVDLEGKAIYATFPELSTTAIKAALDSELAGLEDTQVITQVQEVLKSVVEEVAIDRLVNRYVACVVEAAGDVEKDSEKVTAGDVTQKYTVVSVDIDEADAINMVKAVLKEARDDKELENIIKIVCKSKLADVNPDEVYNEFVAGIDELLEELNDTTVTTGEQHFTLSFWVNNKGEVVGAGMEVDNMMVKCLSVEKGNKFGVKVSAGSGLQNVTFEGGGKISGGKKSGNFTLSAMGADIINVKTEDLEVKEKDGGFNGKITVQPVEEISGMLSMIGAGDMQDILSGSRIELIGKDNSVELAAYTNEQLFASVHVSATQKQGDAVEVAVPANFVDSEDANAMNTWAAGLSLNAVIDKFREAGAPELLLSVAQMGLAQEVAEEQAPAEEVVAEDVIAAAAEGGEIVLPEVELEMPTFQ